MALATKDTEITEFAEFVYTEQKDAFVKGFVSFIKQRIALGETQFDNGQVMSLSESKDNLFKEFFNK